MWSTHSSEHMDGANLRKLRRHLERRYGRLFEGETCKMLRSAVNRLHKKGRIKKHPTKANVYKPPLSPAHHIFGTPAQRRAAKRSAANKIQTKSLLQIHSEETVTTCTSKDRPGAPVF